MNALKDKVFYQWVGVTILGFLLMNAIAALSVSNLLPQTTAPFFNTPILGHILLGTTLSICQWLILKNHFSQSYLWIALTVLAVILESILQGLSNLLLLVSTAAFYDQIRGVLLQAIGGAFPAVAQWFYLQSRVKKAWYWIVCSAIATWLTPRLLRNNILVFPGSSPSTFFGVVILGGLFYGLITGIPIVSYIKQQNQTDSELGL